METKISDDALSFGLGAVILQRVDNDWIPVAYVSQSLSETERRYAEIEEKALAITWACEKFANYILGWSFQIEMDHKPLVSLLSTNHFDNFPPRVLHFCLRMAKFNFHNPACPQETAMNSRHTTKSPTMEREGEVDPLQLYEEVEAFRASVTSALPAIKQRLEAYRRGQVQDAVCAKLQGYCKNGWPRKHQLEPVTGAPEGLSPSMRTCSCTTAASWSRQHCRRRPWPCRTPRY